MKIQDCHTRVERQPDGSYKTIAMERREVDVDMDALQQVDIIHANDLVNAELREHAASSFDDLLSGDPTKLKAIREQRAAIRAKMR